MKIKINIYDNFTSNLYFGYFYEPFHFIYMLIDMYPINQDFLNFTHISNFTAALTRISCRVETVKSDSVPSLIKGCVLYFAQFQETVLNLECALNLVTLIETLNKHNDEKAEVNKLLGNKLQI